MLLYHQPSAADSNDAFPLAPFLASLVTIGIRPTFHDYERISRVLGSGGRWDLNRLRFVLASLLVRNPDQEAAFQRRFDDFFGQVLDTDAAAVEIDMERALAELRRLREQPAKPVESPAIRPWLPGRVFRLPVQQEKSGWKNRLILGVGLASLLVIAIVALWLYFGEEPKPVPESPPMEENRPPASETPAQRHYPKAPFIKDIIPVHEAEADRWRHAAGLAGLLLLITLGYGLWLWRSRKPPQDKAPVWDDALPRLFQVGRIGGEPAPRLDRETLDHLADSLGYFQSEQAGRHLDVPASVLATLYRGGFPALVFERSRQVRNVLILEDAYAESLTWNPIAGELARGLAQRGVPVTFGRFRGVPEQFHDTEGRQVYLEDLEDQRRGFLLLIFSDGKGLRQHRDRFVLEAIARWPRAAWMELREPRFWDESSALLVQMGVAVYPASQEGLLQVMGRLMTEQGTWDERRQELQAWRGVPARGAAVALTAYLERLLGDALPWAQACAMLPPPVSLGLADALRRRFHPELPPERIERLLLLPGSTFNSTGIRFSRPVLAILCQGFLARRDDREQHQVLEFLLDQIREVEPEDKHSLAHQAWEWRLERVRLQLDPDRALQRLAELAQGPLGESIKGELGPFRVADRIDPGDTTAIPLRCKPRTRRGLQRLRALSERCGVAETEAYPELKIHRAVLAMLALSCVVAWGTALWLYLQPGQQLTLALQTGALEPSEALLEKREQDGWRPVLAQGRGRRWVVTSDGTYRLALVNEGQTALLSLEPVTRSSEIALTVGAKEPCRETLANGVTVLRCPPGVGVGAGEAVTLPGWREQLSEQAPARRLLSVGLEIRTGKVAGPHADALAGLLLQSRSVDLFYRVDLSADGALPLERALAQVWADLGPWPERTQLLWWTVGNDADRLALPDFPAFGRVLALGKGGDVAWMKALRQLLVSGDRIVLREQNILAALRTGEVSGQGEEIRLMCASKVEPAVTIAAFPQPEMVEIPAGEFSMGSPENEPGRDDDEHLHQVAIKQPFEIGKYEVTVGEFRRFVEATGYRETEQGAGCYTWIGKEWSLDKQRSWRQLGFEQSDKHPVVCVSWNDAMAYIDWLSEQTGQRYRLPTEAEWEYAARAGAQAAYFWGGDPNVGCAYANGGDQTAAAHFGWKENILECQDGYVFTAPVGSFQANAFGLHDMLGNAWEWTCSDYDKSYKGGELECASKNRAGLRVLRGGSWNSEPRNLRAGGRDRGAPGNRSVTAGFRLARTL